MSYRLGYDRSFQGDFEKAVYRAMQDANAALRYLVNHAEHFKIDPSWIFIGGNSAGAINALYTVYASQSELNQYYPALETQLGPLNTSGNGLKVTFSIQGLFNNQGSVVTPLMSSDEMIPTISFHSALDTTVPIGLSSYGLQGSRIIHEVLEEIIFVMIQQLRPLVDMQFLIRIQKQFLLLNVQVVFLKVFFVMIVQISFQKM